MKILISIRSLLKISISIKTFIEISISIRTFLKISISISKRTFLKISISVSISIREFCKVSISMKYCIDKDLAYRTPLGEGEGGGTGLTWTDETVASPLHQQPRLPLYPDPVAMK